MYDISRRVVKYTKRVLKDGQERRLIISLKLPIALSAFDQQKNNNGSQKLLHLCSNGQFPAVKWKRDVAKHSTRFALENPAQALWRSE